jgi:hypothetical protein
MSTTLRAQRPIKAKEHRRPAAVMGLAALFAVLAVGAIQGGLAMIIDPLTPLGMPTGFLERTPIESYFWPGVFLLAIAATSLLTVAGLLLRWRWQWARPIESAMGYRWPWLGAIATGSVLLAFEIIELFMVPFHPVMHPLLIAGSVTIIGLALTSSTRNHLRVGKRARR